MKILVTGGLGYIGSHTIVELSAQGHELVILDNLSNSRHEVLAAINTVCRQKITFIAGDIRNTTLLVQVFNSQPDIDAVIHFAGLKAVGESVTEPLRYYDNNVAGTLSLLQAMQNAQCKTLIFSSSATVYKETNDLPLTESHPLGTTNPYGASKLIIENMLRDLHASDNSWRIGILRYFNPVGAHSSALLGENPRGIPNNLMPYIAQVAAGIRPQLQVFGNNYPTPDGTGVRDFIHVVDLAKGHVKALDALPTNSFFTVNLGTGKGYSVLEMIHTFEQVSGQRVPYQFTDRRPGDIACCYADPGLAKNLLSWQAELGLDAMCEDTWRWQQNCASD